jgi:hypothetical protein
MCHDHLDNGGHRKSSCTSDQPFIHCCMSMLFLRCFVHRWQTLSVMLWDHLGLKFCSQKWLGRMVSCNFTPITCDEFHMFYIPMVSQMYMVQWPLWLIHVPILQPCLPLPTYLLPSTWVLR